MTTKEEWRPVVGWEDAYEVSSRGQVRATARVMIRGNGTRYSVRPHILTPFLSHGYPTVKLERNRVRRTYRVHLLVLAAFVGPRPDAADGCHCDGDRKNNVPENLRWDTRSGNMLDSVKHGSHHNARKTHCKRNHPFDDVYITKNGARQCRRCRRELKRMRKAAFRQ